MTPSDVKIVADNIDDFIEVSDGISRLRKAVLTLAVSGNLVQQEKKDGIAQELYVKIQATQVPAGRRKKVKKPLSISDQEVPFEIPSSWQWVQLPELYTTITPPGKIKSTEIEDVGKWPVIDQGEKFISGYTSSGKPINVDTPVVVFGDHTLNVKLIDFDFVAGADGTKILKPICVDSRYLFLLVEQFKPQSRGYSRHFKQLNQKLVPLAPLAEQKRIVEKVQSVMQQLDELEAKKRERDEARTRLARSAMQSLGKGDTKVAFDQLTELIRTPADIKELENALLTIAVSGKIVPQDMAEGTGGHLYAQLQKAQGERNVGRQRTRVFEPITPEEIPHSIPTTWEWVRFGSVFTDYSSGSTPGRGNSDYYKDGQINWYKSGELNDGHLSADSEEKISKSALENCHLRVNKKGDLLIAMYGATAGRVAMLANEGATNQAVWGGTPKGGVDLKYLFLYILQSRNRLLETSSGAAQPNISGEKIAGHLLALPPTKEQNRIVKKVDQIFTLISILKKQIDSK